MTLLLKDPDAVLDYAIDWGAEYLGGECSRRALAVAPARAGRRGDRRRDFDGRPTRSRRRAASPGKIYRLVNQVTS